jgi:signal transduction histidine kinase
MKRYRRSLRLKLFGVVLMTTLATLVVSVGMIVAYDLRGHHQELVSDMTTQSELLGHMTASALAFDDRRLAAENLGLLRLRPKVRSAVIYTARGDIFATYAASAEDHDFPQAPEVDTIRMEGKNVILFKPIVDNGVTIGAVYLRADHELAEIGIDYLGIAGAATAVAVMIVFLMMMRLGKLVTSPILGIAGVALEVMIRRDYSRRAEKMSDDEVGTLVDAFNNMLAEIEHSTRALEASNREIAREAEERSRVQQEVMRLNVELETRVHERTAELELTNDELTRNNRELDAFAYVASHDLKSPLRGIDQLATWITEDLGEALGDDTRNHLRLMRSRIARMEMLLDDLLAYSRVGRVRQDMSDVDTRSLITETFELLSANLPVELVVAEDMPAIVTLHTPLELVFRNLIGNAIKHHDRPGGRIEVGVAATADGYAFTVTDDGPGILPEHHERVFGMFQTLRPRDEVEGSGMGLALVRKTVESVGGTISLESKGRGTCFRFTWPNEITMRKYLNER